MSIDGGSSFQRLDGQRNLRQQVSEELRAALVTGRMSPGVMYSAPVLADMLGVSATPVREAMLDLVREGLVDVVRNKGYRVASLSDEDLDHLTELRMLVEVPAMTAIAERCEGAIAAEVEALRDLATELERAAQNMNLMEYVGLDTLFHTRFLSIHGNPQLVEFVRDLRGRSRLYGLEQMARSGRLMESTLEHRRLIDLALARDGAGMADLMRRHLGRTRTEWAAPIDVPGPVSPLG